MSDDIVEVFTDGACKGNPGPGGWGALLKFKGAERELWGGEANTTNNRMELMAAIQALAAPKRPCQIRLTTPRASRLRMPSCGRPWTSRFSATRSSGAGCAAIPAIPRTSGPTSWPTAASMKSGRPSRPPRRNQPRG